MPSLKKKKLSQEVYVWWNSIQVNGLYREYITSRPSSVCTNELKTKKKYVWHDIQNKANRNIFKYTFPVFVIKQGDSCFIPIGF